MHEDSSGNGIESEIGIAWGVWKIGDEAILRISWGDYSIHLEREGWMGVVDVCGLWFGITIGELKTKERRGVSQGGEAWEAMGGMIVILCNCCTVSNRLRSSRSVNG